MHSRNEGVVENVQESEQHPQRDRESSRATEKNIHNTAQERVPESQLHRDVLSTAQERKSHHSTLKRSPQPQVHLQHSTKSPNNTHRETQGPEPEVEKHSGS